jgi:flagellar capping protein FliD
MAQVIQKPYECLGCKQQIRISKIENVAPGQKKKWDKFELDGITPHVCHKPNQQQEQPLVQQQQLSSNINNKLSKEIAAIKAQLLDLVSRLDRLEQELHTR